MDCITQGEAKIAQPKMHPLPPLSCKTCSRTPNLELIATVQAQEEGQFDEQTDGIGNIVPTVAGWPAQHPILILPMVLPSRQRHRATCPTRHRHSQQPSYEAKRGKKFSGTIAASSNYCGTVHVTVGLVPLVTKILPTKQCVSCDQCPSSLLGVRA